MKKKGYYEYDPVIYPRKLWVHIGTDFKELAQKVFDGVEIDEEKEYRGAVYHEITRKSDDKYGILVTFPNTNEMTMSVCAHEASHVCDDIEEAIGMDHGGEASAYLLGWIAGCINKARLGIGDFVEIKDKEE
jgi:hypothetical protein